MHWLWFFFLNKRQFSWLLIAVLIAVGAYSVILIPKESAPEVIIPIGIISVSYPGASAEDMEQLVTNKIEDAIANVENIDSITSTSQDAFSIITAQFTASADIDESLDKLKEAVDRVENELPEDATDPIVSEVNFANQPILVVAVSADLPAAEFTALSEDLADDLKSVGGVSRVDVSGVRDREVQVVVRQEALLTYGTALSDISRAIAGANISIPIGVVTTDNVEYAIKFEADIEDPNEIANIPVLERNGQVVYVRDIAEVSNSVERESTRSRISLAGEPAESAMTLSIYKQAGYDVTKMSESVRSHLDELQQQGGLLEGAGVLIVFDQGEYVKRDLTDLVGVGFETVTLVVISLLLTIGWRESLVAALSIPLSFVIAFIGLYASGNTINFVSLFALILAIGILVDSGIVVTEAIHTRRHKFNDAHKAARESIREYAWPLIGGTMTTVAVFVPLFFLSGIIGEFIKSIPFTLIFVLLASIVVALGMVPLIALKVTKSSSSNRFEEIQEEYTRKAQKWYREHLIRFLQNPKGQRIFIWSLAGALVVSLALPFTGILKVVFFPPEDVDFVFISVETPQGTPIEQTDLPVRAVEEVLYGKEYIASFTTTIGAGSAFTGSTAVGGKFGNITVNLTDKDDRELASAEIVTELREELSEVRGADIEITEQEGGPPSGAPVLIRFFGDDLDQLAVAVSNAENILNSIPGTTNVTASTKSSATEFVLVVDRAKASAAGVSLFSVGEVLRSAVFGINATTITREGEDIDVVVKLNVDRGRTDPSATPDLTIDMLRNIAVPTSQGGSVLLGSIMTEELATANASIVHEDRERTESVTAYTNPGTTALEVVNQFRARESEINMPPDIRISYGGETEDINQSFREMFFALIGGLLLMLAILVLVFDSIRYSLYLLSAVPLSLIGVFGGLALTAQPVSFTSLLGVIALAGVIINHAIILLDSMLHHHRTRPDDPLLEVVADSSVTRLRPIVLTTITTVIGMVPLSTISAFWSPLAFTIMFGLSFAMILTLVLVPTLFYRHEKKLLERKKAEVVS